MPYTARSLHVRELSIERARKALPRGTAFAILGANDAWTSLVPLGDDGMLRGDRLAKALRRSVLHVWLDEASEIVYQLYPLGGFPHELRIPFDHTFMLGPRGEEWIRTAVGVVSKDAADELRVALTRPAREVQAWALAGGLERLFRVPCATLMPVPCDDVSARERVANAELIAARPLTAHALSRAQWLPRSSRNWSASDRAIIDAHLHYLTEVWTARDWKLYYRYKKHLPAEYRHEVDRLVDAIMNRLPPREIRAKLETILAKVWDADDWAAVIADPAIGRAEEPVRRDAWYERVATLNRRRARAATSQR